MATRKIPHNPVAANTLFHFTSNLNNLENILIKEFLPKYCRDDWSQINKEMRNPAWSMVCFCDIPLSQIRNHISKYGNKKDGGYAIGLKKKWGILKRITPVLYFHTESPPMIYLSDIAEYANSKHESVISRAPNVTKTEIKAFFDDPLIKDLNNITAYCKPYKGKMWKKESGKFDGNIEDFYEEREWRYIPYLRDSTQPIKLGLFEKEFCDKLIKEKEETKLEKYKLSFEPNDIKYIIVNKETEIPKMIQKIREIKAKYSDDEKDLLITRIISMEHILADF